MIFPEVKIIVVEANIPTTHTKVNTKVTFTKVITTKATVVCTTIHAEGNNYGQFRGRSCGHGRGNYHGHSHGTSNYRGNNNYQYHQYYGHDGDYQPDQYSPPCALCGGYNHSPKHCFKGEHDINNIMENKILVDVNHNKVVYIHKREHDDPHGLPQQQYLEGCTETEHTLYSHAAISSPEIDSFKKLEYIYQPFQDSKKIYESDPDAVRHQTDDTLYPHINNDIEYGLFEDVINNYYLDSQIKVDFNCSQECYTDIQQTQQEQ